MRWQTIRRMAASVEMGFVKSLVPPNTAQSDLINERLLAFLREGELAVTWAFLLHDEFKRVVWEMAHPSGVNPKSQGELSDAIQGIVGWLPSDIPEAAPHRVGERHREVAEMIMKDGSRNTEHARGLLDAVNHSRFVAHEVSAGWAQQKRAMIESLKKQKRVSLADDTDWT